MALDIDAFGESADDFINQKQTEANKPAPSTWENVKNTVGSAVDSAADAAGAVGTFASNTAQDMNNAYHNYLEKQQELTGAYTLDKIDVANNTGDYTEQNQAVTDMQHAGGQLAFSPIKEASREIINAYADDDESSLQSLAQNLRRSTANVEYFMTDDEKIAKAKEMSSLTDIPVDSIMNDSETYKKAIEIYDYTMKQKKLVPDGDFSMEKVWEEFPGLKDIAGMDPQAAALALHDIESIRSTKGVIDTFTKMLEFGNVKLEYDNLKYKEMIGKANDNDKARMEDLKQRMKTDIVLPSFLDDPMSYVAAGIAGSAPEMWQSITQMAKDGVEGALAGSLAGAAIGSVGTPVGSAAGAAAGGIGGFATGAMRGYAARQAAINGAKVMGGAMARFGAFKGMYMPEAGDRYAEYSEMTDKDGKPLLSPQAAKDYAVVGGALNAGIEMADFGIITKSLKGSPHASTVIEKIITRAQTEALAKQEVKDFAMDRAGSLLKVTAAETAEEGIQAVSDDLVHNNIEATTGDTTNGGIYSPQTIAARSLVAMGEALPGSLGFGMASSLGGVAGGSLGLARDVKHIAQENAKYDISARKTMAGTIMLEQLQQTVADSRLKHTAPDVQEKLLRTQLDGTGFENAYVDTEMALEKENGLEDLKKIAKAAGYSNEDLQAAIDTKGNILVPVEKFAQAESSPALLEAVSFSPEAEPVARMAKTAQEVTEQMKTKMQDAIDRQMQLTQTVTSELFPAENEERELASAAIYANPENPAQGWHSLYQDALQEKMKLLAPALEVLQNSQEYADENGRVTRKQEELARKMVTGDKSAPQIQGWSISRETAAENAESLGQMNKNLQTLEKIKERMTGLNGVEMRLTQGLSKEGFSVYRNLMADLETAGGKPARAARMNAILFARHADIVAETLSKKENKPYTAMNYYRERYGLDISGQYANGTGLYKQQNDTAFKKWFGDSKVVDEDGKPLVVYHTGTMGDTYDITKSRSYNGSPDYELPGIYLTADKNESLEYGDKNQVKALYASIKNPFNGNTTVLHKELGTWRKVMDHLIKQGYDGIIDDDGYGEIIAFDPKQIKSVDNSGTFDSKTPNIYKQVPGVKSATTDRGGIMKLSNGQRIISLFENADESTFLHEMGHMFLMDLEDLSKIDELSQKELAIVDDWATWQQGAAKEYKDTPFGNEFAVREKSIVAAETAGDVDEADRLKATWRQERFARAFEMYLQNGNAPAAGLKAVFRKFKKFLKDIYIGFTSSGGRATPKVEAIMARMIATESEIEEASLDDRYKDIAKAGGEKLFTESEKETYERWHEESLAEAKEKLMAVVMQDLKEAQQEEQQQRIAAEHDRKLGELQNKSVYLAEEAARLAKDENIVLNFYPSIEAYKEELANTKPLQEVLDSYMEAYAKELDKETIESHFSEERIAEIMDSVPYRKKLAALEARAFAEKEQLINRIDDKTKASMRSVIEKIEALPEGTDLTVDKDDDRVKSVMQAINRMRFSTKWEAGDFRKIESMMRSATREELSAAMKDFQAEAAKEKANREAIERAAEGKLQMFSDLAKKAARERPIHEACNFDQHRRSEKIAARRVQQMVKAGNWQMARSQQEARYISAAMAAEAKKMQDRVTALTTKVEKQLKVRSVKLPKDERYWHKHLAYVLRLAKEDAILPEGGVTKLEDIFGGLNESLDLEYTPADILDLAQREGFNGYRSLTIGEFEEAVEALDILYTTGRDKFKMKTIAGKQISDVVEEILQDSSGYNGAAVKKRMVEDDAGGLGYNDIAAKVPGVGKVIANAGQKYLAVSMKPEEMLKMIGEKAHRYIYGTYEQAANREAEMTAANIYYMRDVLSVYSHKEKLDWQKKKYSLQLAGETEMLSKENIICMALNLGNEINTARLCAGFGITEENARGFIYQHMQKKDWETVQKIWDHLNSFWSDTVKVEQDLNGVTLKKQTPKPFEVEVDGEKIHMDGGYYPIKANPAKNSKTADQSVDEAARRTMSGAQVLGTGRGFTKARSEQDVGRAILLKFDVIPEHLQNVIHNISYRIAARDVYRLVNDAGFREMVESTMGRDFHNVLKEWAVDCWRIVPGEENQATGFVNKSLSYLRRNSVLNIMGYRLWPVVENATNLFPVMDKLGTANAMAGIGDFYAHRREYTDLLHKSMMMKNRINNMDRDIRSQPGLFNEDMKVPGWLKEHAYSMMVYSDLMFSAPLWCRSYKDSFQNAWENVNIENEQNKRAVVEAQQDLIKKRSAVTELYKQQHEINAELESRNFMENGGDRATSSWASWPEPELRAEIDHINEQLAPLKKELFEAEVHLDSVSELQIMTPKEINAEAERRAIASADGSVRETFGSGETKDLASVQRGSELTKLFTAFYSFFNTQANAILAAYYKGKYAEQPLTGWQNTARWMPFAKAVLFRIILTSALGTAMKMVLLGDGSDDKNKYRKIKGPDGKDKKEEIPFFDRFLKQFAKNTLSTVSGTAWGLREVGNLMINLFFDGTDYGRGVSPMGVALRAFDQGEAMYKLIAEKDERDEKLAEKKAREEAKYSKMTKKQKKAFDNKQQYKKPEKRITYTDIAKAAGGMTTALTATKTGITDTMANSVFTTMQYLADDDGRYDSDIKNIIWSAIWNKKPVDRVVPEKPQAPAKKKKGRDKK